MGDWLSAIVMQVPIPIFSVKKNSVYPFLQGQVSWSLTDSNKERGTNMTKSILKIMRYTLLVVLAMAMLTACAKDTPAPTPVPAEDQSATTEKAPLNIMALSGPTGMGMVKLMDDSAAGVTLGEYNISLVGAADEITGKIINKEIDIAAVPCNLASVLYNKTEGQVQVAAINTLGVLYVLEKGDEIQSVADLKGKTIVSTGKGTTPEYVLNYLLEANGLDPQKDVTIEYKAEAAELAAALQSGTATIALAPQPFATTVMAKNAGVRVALDVTEEWEKAQGADPKALVTGTIIVRKEVLENNKEAVDQFLAEYQASTAYINDNLTEGATLVEKYNIAPAAIAEKAIPQCNIVYMDNDEMQKNIEAYLTILHAANPASVGGKLPDEQFYYHHQ